MTRTFRRRSRWFFVTSLAVAAACSTSPSSSSKTQGLAMGGNTYGGSGGGGSDGGISDGRPGEGGSGGDGGTTPDDGGVDDGGPATDGGGGSGSGSGSGSGDGSGSGSGSGDGSGSGSGDGSGSGSGDGSGSGSGDGSGSGSGDGSGSGGGSGNGSGSNGCGSDSGSNSGGCGSGDGSGSGSGGGSGGGSGSGGGGGGSDCDYYPEDCGGGGGSGSGSGSNNCKPYSVNDPEDDQEYDLCYQLAEGYLADEDVSQEVLDLCNCKDPEPPSCGFMPDPFFDEDEGGCVVWDPSYGYLGNVNEDCPTDVYLQQALCLYMISTVYPLPQSANPFKRPAYPQADPPPKKWDNNFTWDFDETDRSVVVIGSSMLSTHFQQNNGEMCAIGSADRVETTYDDRGMPGNNFYASPAYLFPWTRAWAGARTGFDSGSVVGALPGTQDACKVNWGFPASPMNAGFDWLKDKPNPLMITDGGLINDLKSSTGGWSDTLKALVACQAMQMALPKVNNFLDKAWADENEFDLRFKGKILIKGKWVEPKAPQMKVGKTLKGGAWTDALDVPQGQPLARCALQIESTGNGIIIVVHKAMTSLASVGVDVPAILPLADVSGNLKAIKDKYRPAAKQIWLQFPHMESAMVSIKVPDIGIFLGGEVAREFLEALGLDQTISVGVVEPQLQQRVAKVSDDLNRYMYNAIGCAAKGAYVTGHGPIICEADGTAPMVVITRDSYPGWNFQDHQTTVAGGMPHESASGAKKLGDGLIEADGLTVPPAP